MEEILNITHYLRLAYLAEVAIVVNLAYLELKSKQDFTRLNEKMSSPLLSTLIPSVTGICNKKKKCSKCNDETYLLKKFRKIDINYISQMGAELHSMHINGDNNNRNSTKLNLMPLWDAWRYSECFLLIRPLLFIFHSFIKKNIDRGLSIIILGLSTLLLVLMTMIDSNIDKGLFAEKIKSFVVLDWTLWIWLFFVVSIFIAGFFWIMWGKLIREYECLSCLLAEAYQKKSPGSLDKFISELK